MIARTGLSLAFLLAFSLSAAAQDAADFFRQNCMNCHTVGGGRITGPDLKNVTQRKERPWLVKFLQDPKAMIESGDPYAVKLQGEARGVVMPTVAGMSPERAQLLLDMVDAESKLAKSQFAGLQISNRPFTPQEIAQGQALFGGDTKLAGGGPACVSCHTMRGLPGLSGGRLGPDLTLVYERLQGRKGLAQWLVAPASPTMAPIFKKQALKPEEILPLVAYFEAAAKQGGQDDSAALVNFFLLGLGGMVIGLVSLDAVWKRRFRAVRRPLVQKARRKSQ
jgi:mono/diheme cytochrome c family protein